MDGHCQVQLILAKVYQTSGTINWRNWRSLRSYGLRSWFAARLKPAFIRARAGDNRREVEARRVIIKAMSTEEPRMDANSRDRSPDHEYTLSIEQTAERYAQAGHPRTPRAIQKYCALSKLDCHKVETETGERYLVASYSIDRHIAYINEVRTVANNRDQTRTVASVRTMENKDNDGAKSAEQPRPDATVRAPDERYVVRLENENEFLRDQIGVKDGQIKELTERARETNVLIAGLQKMLTPLLGTQSQDRG
jgi:hypothetical protein